MSLKISKNSKNRNEERKAQNNEKVTSESRRNRRRSRERSVTRLNRLGGREHHRDRYSPIRKKPAPINELDLLNLTVRKEEKQTAGEFFF